MAFGTDYEALRGIHLPWFSQSSMLSALRVLRENFGFGEKK
jgi:hypothetical protein